MTSTQPVTSNRPGDWVDTAPRLADLEPGRFNMEISTDRYVSPEVQQRERESIWMKIWQVVGREADLPEVGDWKVFELFDQSYILVRGNDGVVRGFVNACRHRGNPLCNGSGNSKRGFLCQYHLWSYDLEGALKGILAEKDLAPIDKSKNSLIQVSVDTAAGFLFLNPDPKAESLGDYLGAEVLDMLEPYHLDRMVTVMDVREKIDCNWKVVVDAFSEGYHISGIHPQLLRVMTIESEKSRYRLLERHAVSCSPFEVAHVDKYTPEEQVQGIRELPETFPSLMRVLPRFEEIVDSHRTDGEPLSFPDGVTARTILQKATREVLTETGLDVDGLTDAQMSDNHGWVLFPNFFMTVRAGEATVILAQPDPEGDPNRCVWQIISFMYLPDEMTDALRATPFEVKEPGEFKYFEALQQDYEQMPRQQRGLRNEALDHLLLVSEEVVVAHFHSVLDRYLAAGADA
ncbi:Rieske-like 2Fe-2S protein [Rhodococcus sp. SMB37]|uniref:aromatic ring-hydroxylating oxygenase subunit alpha n=1 Tax=Rhodococcus sp. SMB37 TaxID=2512213 RepID=UPI00104D262C|nr:aromatic ring-hydroxylating dioxygenase subunit alpha [Rhodococcus sp. SMB37]TCN55759.1 Rieske-like 2Fe-2S protein [Rhodococcus sp. SMB37]